MKTLLLSFLLLFIPYKEKYGCLELDIVILVDISGSLQNHEGNIHDALNVLIDKLELSEEGLRMGIVAFSSSSFVKCSISADKEYFKAAIGTIWSDDGSTNMAGGLYTCFNELIRNGRQGVKKMIIVISDGGVDSVGMTKLAIEQLKTQGTFICSILVTGETMNQQLMKDISNGCYIESSYENLAEQIKELDICI